jgi:hypothetical protein
LNLQSTQFNESETTEVFSGLRESATLQEVITSTAEIDHRLAQIVFTDLHRLIIELTAYPQ